MPEKFKKAVDLFAILEHHRSEQGVSLRELSKRAGMSHGSYWYSAQRGADITINSAAKYADALGLDLSVTKRRRGKA